MPPDRHQWATAYAKQSRSDFLIYEALGRLPAAECHRLHYLQMASEKIAKAYSFRDRETSIELLLTSHVAFSEVVENLLKAPHIRTLFRGRDNSLKYMGQKFHNIAREVEKLAPAVDRDGSPQNAEYPWQDRENIVVPCEYTYPNLRLLKEPGGLQFLQFVKIIIEDFDKISIS